MPLALASAPSSSGPVEAPVHTLIENGSPASCAASIRRASASGTALGYKAPKSVALVSDLPLSSVGKVLRREVRDRYWAGRTRGVN